MSTPTAAVQLWCSRAWGRIWFEQRVPYGRLIFHCSLKTKPPPKPRTTVSNIQADFLLPPACSLTHRSLHTHVSYPSDTGGRELLSAGGEGVREIKGRDGAAVKFTGDASSLQTPRVHRPLRDWAGSALGPDAARLPGAACARQRRLSPHGLHQHVCSLLGLTRAPTGTGLWWF